VGGECCLTNEDGCWKSAGTSRPITMPLRNLSLRVWRRSSSSLKCHPPQRAARKRPGGGLRRPRTMIQATMRPQAEAAYFAGLEASFSTRGCLISSSISAKLRSNCTAACIQVLAMSSNTWRCRCDLVSSAQRKHSCANSRNSLGDAAIGQQKPIQEKPRLAGPPAAGFHTFGPMGREELNALPPNVALRF
jgi:hypothetical protein